MAVHTRSLHCRALRAPLSLLLSMLLVGVSGACPSDAGIERVGFMLFDPGTYDVEYVYPPGGRYLQVTGSYGY